jgi:anti-sigma factor RsiW
VKHLTDADLLRYLDRGSSDSRRVEMARHLDTCAACRRALEQATTRETRVEQWLSALEEADQPMALDVAAAWARVERRSRVTPHARSGWPWAAGLAATVLAIVVAGQPPRSTTAVPTNPTDDGAVDFVAMDGAPIQMGLVVRATVPASMLASFGVTGGGDVQADFVIGEDGRPHAFRIIR